MWRGRRQPRRAGRRPRRLQGPKVRVGKFAGGSVTLTAGGAVTVTTRDGLGGPADPCRSTPRCPRRPAGRPHPPRRRPAGFHVLSTDGTDARCEVLTGGLLKDRKGMNLPGVAVSSPALTEKDRLDAAFALGLGVDFLALSFVRRPWDVTDLKALISSQGKATPVIAKIEKPEAMSCLDEILAESDGFMVARGDLGVEMPPEAVPIVQRELVELRRLAGKPVIVATQMLESMVSSPWPTRAEVTDVSAAVFLGADAVMLSAETAAGAYPVKAVEMMDRVARQVETWQSLDTAFRSITEDEKELPPPLPVRLALARSTAQLSRDLRVRAVTVRTKHGTSAGVVSATRPAAPIVALTCDEAVARRLALSWGVVPRLLCEEEFAQPTDAARRQALGLGLADPGEVILLLSGFGKNEPMLAVLTV
ncbi:MAG: pyruvate kinase [Gemmataceae bacterium]